MPQHMRTPAPVIWFCCASAFLGGARPLLLSPCNTCARAHGRARNAPATRALAGNPIIYIHTLLPARLCPQAGDGRACSLTPTSALSAYVQHGPAMCNVTYTDTYTDTYAHISKHTHMYVYIITKYLHARVQLRHTCYYGIWYVTRVQQ